MYQFRNIIWERTARLWGYVMPINIIIDNSVIELYILNMEIVTDEVNHESKSESSKGKR